MTRTQKRPLLALALTLALGGCSGPPVAAAITGEPVCPDFTLGASANKMRGGLRNPVRVTVKDGKNAVARAMFVGKRVASDPNPPVMLPDGNATYTVEWSQCENERAAVPVTGGKARERGGGTAYDCGEEKVYKTETLTTKKGDLASHALVVPAPPNVECWKDERPVEEPKAEAADAGAEDAAPAEVPDAAPSDASAEDAAASAVDGGTGGRSPDAGGR